MKRLLPLLCAVLLAPVPVIAQQIAGRLIAFQGRVEVLTTSWSPASLNQDLYAGNTIRTHSQSRAVLLLADET
ncbi:MAG: hypothetical protein P8Z74_02630, partial [Acidobacteriota bacterium]